LAGGFYRLNISEAGFRGLFGSFLFEFSAFRLTARRDERHDEKIYDLIVSARVII
jgi:hypothetical protein